MVVHQEQCVRSKCPKSGCLLQEPSVVVLCNDRVQMAGKQERQPLLLLLLQAG